MAPLVFGIFCIAVYIFLKKAFFSRPGHLKNVGFSNSKTTNRETLAKYNIGVRRKPQTFAKLVKPAIEFNDQNKRVLDFLENTKKNIILTGKAGSGKSTLLTYFRATTKKNVVMVAPTGVAAINVQGQTIHRFFKFRPDITVDTVKKHLDGNRTTEVYKKLDTLIIDEISMVRADLLDCVDTFLRIHGPNPGVVFGGVQIVAVGDLYQLPPVVKDEEEEIFETFYKNEFFFSAKCMAETNFVPLELTKVFRQTDPVFIEILNAIREGNVSQAQLDLLNRQVNRDFNTEYNDSHVRIWLVPTRAQASEINNAHMARLQGPAKKYKGFIEGQFPEHDMPTSPELELKVGTQVMMLNNDPKGKWVNGDVAKVVSLNSESIRVLFEDNSYDDIERHTWDSFKHSLDAKAAKIIVVSEGSFAQFPVKPAWALTIHKSQGKTYDRVVLDVSRGTFAPGQTYVALSRCRNLQGLILKTPIQQRHIFIDPKVSEFMNIVSELARIGHVPKELV